MNPRQGLAVVAAATLFLVMAVSLIGLPWPTQQHEIPVVNNTTANGTGVGIANSLFYTYPITLILIGIILASAMIGGVYLAKMEQKGRIGP